MRGGNMHESHASMWHLWGPNSIHYEADVQKTSTGPYNENVLLAAQGIQTVSNPQGWPEAISDDNAGIVDHHHCTVR